MNARTRNLAFGIAGLVLTAVGAQADMSKWTFSSTHYYFRFWGLPDLDQVRTILANDGTQYCVPTTGINWLGYLTNHGASALGTGPANWEHQDNYDLASFLIEAMGSPAYMNTNAFGDGTTVTNSVYGLQTWLGEGWVVDSWIRDESWSPDFEFMSSKGMNGAHLIPGVGWYYLGDPCLDRDGGHAFAAAGMFRDGATLRIDICDPATDDDETADQAVLQSRFTTESYYLIPQLRNPKCNNPAWQVRDMSLFLGFLRLDNGVFKYGYLDYVRSIFPQFVAVALPSDEITYAALEIDGGLEPVRSFMSFNDEPVMDLVLGADLGHSLVVLGTPGDSAVWVHTPGFEQWEQIDVGADAPTDVVSGRHREAYVLDGSRLICFDIDTHAVEADEQMPAEGQAIAYDDTNDEVIVLSTAEHVIMRYAYGLEGAPTLQFLNDLPVGDDASIAWNPTDGAVWVIVDGSPLTYRLTIAAGQVVEEVVNLPGVVAPQAFDFSDYGRLFVSDQGAVKEFVGAGVEYDAASEPFFAGQAAGHALSAARSRTNYEPHLVDEEWFHEVPTGFAESVPDCRGDLDHDGVVAVTDLLALLGAWNTADAFADIAPDGGDLNVDVVDLLAMLGAWGPCPGAP